MKFYVNVQKIICRVLTVLLILGSIPLGIALAAPADNGSFSIDGTTVNIDVTHLREDVNAFYNGERVNINISLTGSQIDANETYSVALPSAPPAAGGNDNFAYFINIDSFETDVTINGISAGKAKYNAQTNGIDITFSDTVSGTDTANLSLGANMAVSEREPAGTQNLQFTVSHSGKSGDITIPVATTKKGFVIKPTLSRITDVGSYTTVMLKIEWEALGGLGLGDYFEVSVPESISEELGINISFIDIDGKAIDLKDNVKKYGTATFHKSTSSDPTSRICCDFNESGSNQLNISGTIEMTGSYTLRVIKEIETLPREVSFTIYVNGTAYEYPIGITPPSLSSKLNKLYKPSQAGRELVDSDKGFYYFKWGISVNNEGLPRVSPPDGLTMHNAVVTDTVVGPGHYIDKSSIYLMCIRDVNLLNESINKKIKDWLPGYTGSASNETIFLNNYLNLTGTAFSAELYGDGSDPNKLKSFTIELGDLESVAVYIGYYAYIEDGSDSEISSYRDYFEQSFMNGSGSNNLYNSDKYFNKVKLDYDEQSEKEVTTKLASTVMKSSMTSGNLNLKIHKENEEGASQKGVVFTLYWKGGSSTYTTDEEGNLEIGKIGSGLYKLEEKTPFLGYRPIEPIYFKVPDTVSEPYITAPHIDLSDIQTFNSSGGVGTEYVNFKSNAKENVIINYPGIPESSASLEPSESPEIPESPSPLISPGPSVSPEPSLSPTPELLVSSEPSDSSGGSVPSSTQEDPHPSESPNVPAATLSLQPSQAPTPVSTIVPPVTGENDNIRFWVAALSAMFTAAVVALYKKRRIRHSE